MLGECSDTLMGKPRADEIHRRPEESVKEDVGILRASPFFTGMQIVGFVQDTETGLLSEVVDVA